jgi:hypothetical protein
MVNSPNRSRNGLHMNNTDQAGANWARLAINVGNLKTVTNLRWLIGHMYHHRGPSKWYRGGRREIMKTINRIRNRRVAAARTAAANLRRARSIRSLVRREVGGSKRRGVK